MKESEISSSIKQEFETIFPWLDSDEVKQIIWNIREKWTWLWESNVYSYFTEDQKKRILKAFPIVVWLQEKTLKFDELFQNYKALHEYLSMKGTIKIDVKEVFWWYLKFNDLWKEVDITTIDFSILDLKDAKFHKNEEQLIVFDIPYIEWESLHTVEENKSLTNPRDKKKIKFWYNQIFEISYKIEKYINDYLWRRYWLYFGEKSVLFQKLMIGLTSKNIKVLGFYDWVLYLEATDLCSSILYWNIENEWKPNYELLKNEWKMIPKIESKIVRKIRKLVAKVINLR